MSLCDDSAEAGGDPEELAKDEGAKDEGDMELLVVLCSWSRSRSFLRRRGMAIDEDMVVGYS